MGVYIKGMEMPKKCYGCFAEYHPVNLLSGTCKLTGESTDGFAYKRREDCPLIGVKTPHDALVELEEVEAEHWEDADGWHSTITAPTIIETEDV